jgi:flagellar motility protein MotE (MotC chaperone)
MKKILTFLALLCVLNLLATAGLVGYLAATDRLDMPKLHTIADLLRHKGSPERLREQASEIIEPPPATAPATAPASRPALADVGLERGPVTAQERLDYARQAMEQERLQLENEAQDLRHRQELLLQLQAQVEAKLRKIEETKKAFEDELAKASSKDNDAGFQKTLALYSELKPKQVKDLFVGMQPDVVVRFMQAMPPDQAAKIIIEFKTLEEKAFINGVLERLRGSGTNSASAKP